MKSHRSLCKKIKFVYAKRLRKNQTPAERIIWDRIKQKQLSGFRFRRQSVIFGFIVDFYCPSRKLVVEIDGSFHIGRQEYDIERTKRIESGGFTIIRFSNEEVMKDVNSVLDKILVELLR